MIQRSVLFSGAMVILAGMGPGSSARFPEQIRKEKPNFLIIMADDCTYNDLPLYGGQNAKTPNIARLAQEGLTFNQAYLAEAIDLPRNFADTPETRTDFSRYLAEITYMDSQVGEILAALNESGADENTLVLFTSEQGSQFPGCKWTNYNTGIHTALIARWPDKIIPGQRTDALVQYTDITPSLVDLAGGNPGESDFDGASFVDVLDGAPSHRQLVYSMHNNLPEVPPYPIRSVCDGKFHYIRNLLPGEIYIERHLMAKELSHDYWDSWVGEDPLKNPESYQLVKRYMRRPPDELYLVSEDPFELNNLSDDQEYWEVKQKLSRALDEWMEKQHDPGDPVDTKEALEAARKGLHLHGRDVNHEIL